MAVFYVIAIIIMIIAGILMKRMAENKVEIEMHQRTISDQKLYDVLLPNNKGRSIDDVVNTLEANKISLEFYLEKK